MFGNEILSNLVESKLSGMGLRFSYAKFRKPRDPLVRSEVLRRLGECESILGGHQGHLTIRFSRQSTNAVLMKSMGFR